MYLKTFRYNICHKKINAQGKVDVLSDLPLRNEDLSPPFKLNNATGESEFCQVNKLPTSSLNSKIIALATKIRSLITSNIY